MLAATLLHPWNRELCEEEDVIAGETGPSSRATWSRCWDERPRRRCPRRAPRATSARHLPAIEPERTVSDWGRSEGVEGLLDRTLLAFLYHYWFRCEVEGIEHVPARAARCWSPTTAAPCRPTPR